MMKFSLLLCQILLINSLFYQTCQAKFSLNSIKTYFLGSSSEKIVRKEIAIDRRGNICLENISGNILIKEWENASIQLQAKKIANKKEMLDDICIETEKIGQNLNIKTTQKTEKNKTTVHYELLVPRTAKLDIKNINGSITISQIDAAINVKTETGDINILNTRGPIIAETNRGTITINKASGNIRAITEYGNINIKESTRNIIAKTQTGAIAASCKTIPALDSISLSTGSGNIELSLPDKTDADLRARTERGKLISDHYITVKPQTVKLNKQTWSRLRKEVEGTLGTGEASIRLSAGRGNITIAKTT